jgi:ParB family chromosome partitioning protein
MGKGLAAILASSELGNGREELRELPVELIVPNPRQPRRSFDEETLRALADSLGERGLLQPVLVRPRAGGTYELIAGERRWRAARMAGLADIPALIREHGDSESLELALVENMAREDLSPVEEGRACAALVEELGLTRAEVGRRVGRSRVAVSNLLRLLELPDEVLEQIDRRSLSEGHGRALLLAEDHAARRGLARNAVQEGWSVRTLEARARTSNAAAGWSARARSRDDVHPDQREAARELSDSLTRALGAEVKVKPAPRGGFRVELALASHEEALELAERLGR